MRRDERNENRLVQLECVLVGGVELIGGVERRGLDRRQGATRRLTAEALYCIPPATSAYRRRWPLYCTLTDDFQLSLAVIQPFSAWHSSCSTAVALDC